MKTSAPAVHVLMEILRYEARMAVRRRSCDPTRFHNLLFDSQNTHRYAHSLTSTCERTMRLRLPLELIGAGRRVPFMYRCLHVLHRLAYPFPMGQPLNQLRVCKATQLGLAHLFEDNQVRKTPSGTSSSDCGNKSSTFRFLGGGGAMHALLEA